MYERTFAFGRKSATMGSVASGSENARFQRAVRTRNVLLSWTAAMEMRPLSLADGLRLCLVLVGGDDPRAPASLLRWHSLYVRQLRPAPEEAQLAFAALMALGGSTRAAAAE